MKGQVNVYMLIIVGALLLAFIVGIFAVAFIGPYIQDLGLQIGGTIDELPEDNSGFNVTQNLQTMSDPVFYSMRFLEWMVYGFIILFIGAIVVVCAFSRNYPIIAVPYAVIVLVLAVSSMFLSSAYQQASAGDSILKSWTMTNFFLTNLPLVIIALGFFGGIAMFVLITTRPEGQY